MNAQSSQSEAEETPSDHPTPTPPNEEVLKITNSDNHKLPAPSNLPSLKVSQRLCYPNILNLFK